MILEYHLFASIPPGGVLVSAAGTPIPPLAAACCGMATSRYFDEEADEAEAALPAAAAAGGGASAADDEFDDYFGDDVDLSDFDEGAAEAETAKGGAAAAGGGASAAAPSAAAGGGASGAAPSSSPSAPPRVPRNDVLFKADARAAFAAMNLHAEYKLPPAPVLARDPDAPSAGRDTCPRALWKLIVSHGGYIEEGRNGVSRSRIITSSGSGGKTRSAAAWAVCTLPLRSMGLAWRQCSSNLCPTWACSWLRPLTCAPSFPR